MVVVVVVFSNNPVIPRLNKTWEQIHVRGKDIFAFVSGKKARTIAQWAHPKQPSLALTPEFAAGSVVELGPKIAKARQMSWKQLCDRFKKSLWLRTWLETCDLCWLSVSRQITHHDERNFVVKISPLAFHLDDMGAEISLGAPAGCKLSGHRRSLVYPSLTHTLHRHKQRSGGKWVCLKIG